jgi:flagellar biosynthesis protein FliQ
VEASLRIVIYEALQLLVMALVPVFIVMLVVGVIVAVIERFTRVTDSGFGIVVRCMGVIGASLIIYPLIIPRLLRFTERVWGQM